MLRIKAYIYRSTGIFLAYREQLEYIESEQYWEDMKKLIESGEYDMKFLQGLLIGMWQVKHGFLRPFKGFKRHGR